MTVLELQILAVIRSFCLEFITMRSFQVTVIRKGKTECYECQPKPHQKTFPGCTIRNTPSEPIHCIVWAKHLFNQLFGEADPDEDVSPDNEDPELGDSQKEETGNVTRISTRQWAQDNKYNAKLIFTKLFHDDIKYLLTMDKLWAKRRPPTPLVWDELSDEAQKAAEGKHIGHINWDHATSSKRGCLERFTT